MSLAVAAGNAQASQAMDARHRCYRNELPKMLIAFYYLFLVRSFDFLRRRAAAILPVLIHKLWDEIICDEKILHFRCASRTSSLSLLPSLCAGF